MFFRRRIVLLTMSLILAILIITVTIVGLVISSNNELSEAEARKAKINPETDSEQELMTSSINNDVPRVDDSDSIDERDSSSFLFPRDLKPTTTSDPISGSGSGHSTAEDEKKNFLHIEEQDNFMLKVETEKTEMPAVSHDEVGSGDSSGEDERHDNDSGSGSGSGSGSAFLNWFL